MTTEQPAPGRDAPLVSRFRGCLLGGAVGDALGAPVEFWSRSEITLHFGPEGVRDYMPAYGHIGAITDDTQMTLFTADALLRSHVRGSTKGIGAHGGLMRRSYLRWYRTQGYSHGEVDDGHMDGWLLTHRDLFAQRAPGNTCLTALRESEDEFSANNESKGCGTVMRVAPIGLYWSHSQHGDAAPEEAFRLGMRSSLITHGHVTATLSAGFLSALITLICRDRSVEQAIDESIALLVAHSGYEETLDAVEAARVAAMQSPNDPDQLALLGEGWVAEEALAIALYCALGCEDFESALSLAVSHDGDSDSTGAIAGNILGALMGEQAIPQRWLAPLELRDVIAEIADDLAKYPDWNLCGGLLPWEPDNPTLTAEIEAGLIETDRMVTRYPPY
ncbi:ADP-ribosylglycohydrolase family protein [Methyloversatilis universalis]|uniref:ADP-ribosylglycohydrolase family protein n=1 Tax=Methyloversatilis universalis TaxID=378211 RepID=UPI00036EC957|nr:ADP-ribosylglycohydrolase family protein [Methyloversatilis universalis]